jgi:hypothetical protein
MVDEIVPGYSTLTALGEYYREPPVLLWHICGKVGVKMSRVGQLLVVASRDVPAIAAEIAARKTVG